MNQVLMRLDEPNGCGRACLATAKQITYEDASKYLPGQENIGYKADFKDTMLHHKVALWKMNTRSEIVTDDQIIRGECAIGKTCILVHSSSSPTLKQHWVNFGGITPEGKIILWWNVPGDEKRTYSPQGFKALYRKGSLNHAHEVDRGSVRIPSWWERLMVWFTGSGRFF